MKIKKAVLLFVLLVLSGTFSLLMSAKETNDLSEFKIRIESIEGVVIESLKIDISISIEIKTEDKVDRQFYNKYYKTYYCNKDVMSFRRPSEFFIISIDDTTIPAGYKVKENNVLIDSTINNYKIIIIEDKDVEKERYSYQNNTISCVKNVNTHESKNRSFILYNTDDRFNIYYYSGISSGALYASRLHSALCSIESYYISNGYVAPDTDTINHTFDVYIKSSSDFPSNQYGSYDDQTRIMSLNYIIFNQGSDIDAFVNTVAHEYFHASIRSGGYSLGSGSIEEMCASAAGFYYVNYQGIESPFIKELFDDRICSYFSSHFYDFSLDSGWYDNFIFAYHLIEEYGFDFLINFFPSNLATLPTELYVDSVLVNEGSSLEEEYETLIQKVISIENNYSTIDDYYSNDWIINEISSKPSNHSLDLNSSIYGNVTIESGKYRYFSLLPYLGGYGCSEYEGYITLTFSSRNDIELFKARVTNTGVYQDSVSIPSEYNSSLGGYSYTYYSTNLGLFMCEELNFSIINLSNNSISVSYSLKSVHHVPKVYQGTTYNLGSTVNDIYYLKFESQETGIYRFELESSINRYYREEITVKSEGSNGLYTIQRITNNIINIPAYNREGSNNITVLLEDGDIYYIKVRSDADIDYCTLKIWYSHDGLIQDPNDSNVYGLWNEQMHKDDYIYSHTITQSGTYNIYFECLDTNYQNMAYVISKRTSSSFYGLQFILMNNNSYSNSYNVYLSSGDIIYISYLDFRGPSSEPCQITVERIS